MPLDWERKRLRDRLRIARLRAAARAERAADAAELRAIDCARFGVDPADEMALLAARTREELRAFMARRPELCRRSRIAGPTGRPGRAPRAPGDGRGVRWATPGAREGLTRPGGAKSGVGRTVRRPSPSPQSGMWSPTGGCGWIWGRGGPKAKKALAIAPRPMARHHCLDAWGSPTAAALP